MLVMISMVLWLLKLKELLIVYCGLLFSGVGFLDRWNGIVGLGLVMLMVGGVIWLCSVRSEKIVFSVFVLLRRCLVDVFVVDIGILLMWFLKIFFNVMYLLGLLIGVDVVCVLMCVIWLVVMFVFVSVCVMVCVVFLFLGLLFVMW